MNPTIDTTVLELEKENFKFSAGHFTIFSASQRESLHGHNFTVAVSLTCTVNANGMSFDYGLAKRVIETECRTLNETFLLPGESPHLRLEEADGLVWAVFGEAAERIPFLPRDITILPIRNVTVEELAAYLLGQLHAALAADPTLGIRGMRCAVYSGPGQGASASWQA